MIAIASITDSMSGDHIFVEKIHDNDKSIIKPWQIAQTFYECMKVIPVNIVLVENDEIIQRWYAGDDYPDDNPYE